MRYILEAPGQTRCIVPLTESVLLFQRYNLVEFSEEETDIIARVGKVFDQAYTRFLDLQKAEEQAREAQIEAALERVRASSMAMHKSDELRSVIAIIFEQLKKLGLDAPACGLLIFDKATGDAVNWLSGFGEEVFPVGYHIPYFEHPYFLAWHDAWKSGEPYAEFVFEGDLKKSFDDFLFEQSDFRNLPPEIKNAFRNVERSVNSNAFMTHGGLGVMGGEEAIGEAEKSIIQRFATVFDQTYTRFLDLQKAEEQARQLEVVFNENQRLLHSILPEQIAEQIRGGQHTIVRRFEQVSILFADIVGFTVLSEKITPKEVVDILNGLFSRFDDLTDKYHLEKIKTIGDAYMVAAGVPEEKDNHAQLMFAFAKDMLHTLQDYSQAIGRDLKIRIGISSGPVVAGVIGKKKFAYDLWGDTVNTAARMEAYGREDCIQVSPTTYAILKKETAFEKIPNVEIKGKGMMDVYLWTP